MKKKELERQLNGLKEALQHMYEYAHDCFPTNNKLFMRDYIVRTKYIGKMKDKKLIEDFKKEFKDWDLECNKIQNYDFSGLINYYDKLKLYEKKQIVIDVYGTKS